MAKYLTKHFTLVFLLIFTWGFVTIIHNSNQPQNSAPNQPAQPIADQPPHPLSIQALRQTSFPGSPIVIEQNLAPGPNYSRHIASYQSENLKIFALLTIPSTDPPTNGWPVIIFNHGWIPPDKYRSDEKYVAYVDGFARNSYIVFRPDYRGHGNSQGQPEGAYFSNAYTIDVLNALASAKTLSQANPKQIGMWGHSMGGFITLRAMVTDPSIKAGVIWGGVVGSYNDIIERWWARRPIPQNAGGVSKRWQRTRDHLQLLQQNQQFFQQISANSFLNDTSGPIQLHHGESDQTVPHELSEILHQQLNQAKQPSELYLYPNSDHNISQDFSTAMQRSIDFFDQHLKQTDN